MFSIPIKYIRITESQGLFVLHLFLPENTVTKYKNYNEDQYIEFRVDNFLLFDYLFLPGDDMRLKMKSVIIKEATFQI